MERVVGPHDDGRVFLWRCHRLVWSARWRWGAGQRQNLGGAAATTLPDFVFGFNPAPAAQARAFKLPLAPVDELLVVEEEDEVVAVEAVDDAVALSALW